MRTLTRRREGRTDGGLQVRERTCVAEVDELFGEQVGEQLHDEQQVLVLVLLGRGVASLPALVVLGVNLQQRQTGLVQLHRLSLREKRRKYRGTVNASRSVVNIDPGDLLSPAIRIET